MQVKEVGSKLRFVTRVAVIYHMNFGGDVAFDFPFYFKEELSEMNLISRFVPNDIEWLVKGVRRGAVIDGTTEPLVSPRNLNALVGPLPYGSLQIPVVEARFVSIREWKFSKDNVSQQNGERPPLWFQYGQVCKGLSIYSLRLGTLYSP